MNNDADIETDCIIVIWLVCVISPAYLLIADSNFENFYHTLLAIISNTDKI